jgi:tetratricopeptide (TPR) repeat protein
MSEHRLILALARSGATSRAWDAFVAAGLDEAETDFEALTLKGRLLKDRARQAMGEERRQLFDQARFAYEKAAALRAESYPLINAAAMALFAGQPERTAILAGQALHLIESGSDMGETPYWGEATRAEALLLLGRTDEARDSLASAIKLAPKAWEDQSSTLRQFALILLASRQASDWLDRFRPPPVMHFNGILGISADDQAAHRAIHDAVSAIAPGFAYGALAAGADIIAAEAAIAAGAELHVVLPSQPEDFQLSSVAPLGEIWSERFDALLLQAESVTICASDAGTSAAGVALAELHAMGLVVERAEQLQAKAIALRIEPADRPALGDPWLHSGRALHHVAVAEMRESPVDQLPQGKLTFDVMLIGSLPLAFEALQDAVQAILASAEKIAALDCRTDDTVRVGSLIAHSAHGMIAASRSAALALLATGLASRIETIGEMASPEGSFEVCLAALVEPPG